MVSLLLAATLAQAAPAAEAAPPAAWDWPTGTPVLYHVETQILTPRTVKYYAANNLDAKAIAVQGGADTTCNAKPEGKSWLVTCDLTWIRIAGRATQGGERLPEVGAGLRRIAVGPQHRHQPRALDTLGMQREPGQQGGVLAAAQLDRHTIATQLEAAEQTEFHPAHRRAARGRRHLRGQLACVWKWRSVHARDLTADSRSRQHPLHAPGLSWRHVSPKGVTP